MIARDVLRRVTGRDALRRLLGGAAVAAAMAIVLAAACASPQPPPGGPPDFTPPRIVSFTPANRSVGRAPDEVELAFDEVVSETPRGAPDLGGMFLVSPRSGDVRVRWRRNRLVVSTEDGFRDSAIYTITLRPGVQDLSNNEIDSTTVLVFSTGGPIPETVVTGAVFDWPAGRPAARALVEAISVVDSTTYLTVADSVGRYRLPFVKPGQYTVRGFIDRNNTGELERTELWDTVTIPLRDSAAVELYTFVHDTIPVRVRAIAVSDSSRRLRVEFDKPLALGQAFTPLQFSLRLLPDSSLAQRVLAVRTLEEQSREDSLRRKAREDSIAAERAAKDSTPDSIRVARADSIARVRRRDSLARAEREAREERRQIALRGGRPLPPRDTTPPPKPNRPTPPQVLVLQLESPLLPDTGYVLVATGVRSLSGIEGDTARRAFRSPKPDTAAERAARDSVVRDSVVRDSVVRDSVVRDSVVRDSVVRDSVRRDSLQRDSARRAAPPDSVPPDSVQRRVFDRPRRR